MTTMQIECPHCQTIFKVTDQQLQVADGMVRCGLCHEVFNALADAVAKRSSPAQIEPPEQSTEPEPATESGQTSEPAQTAEPEPTASPEPIPEPVHIAEPEQTLAPEPDTLPEQFSTAEEIVTPEQVTEPEHIAEPVQVVETEQATEPEQLAKETFTDPLSEPFTDNYAAKQRDRIAESAIAESTADSRAEKSSQEDLFDGVHSKLIPDEYRIPELHRPYSIWRDLAWSIAILLLAFSLFAEYTWFNRNQLVTRSELKPWVEKLCYSIDCNVLGLQDTKQIEMLARNIYSHPNISSALMVSVTMINHAVFAQPYPDISIDFSNVRGEVIASRVFKPGEYLQMNKKRIKLLPAGTAADFHLEIQDPGPDAITYEFSFL